MERIRERLKVMNAAAASVTEKACLKKNRQLLSLAVIVVFISLVVSAIAALNNNSPLTEIKRSGKYGETTSIPLEIEAEYDGNRYVSSIDLEIPAVKFTDAEKEDILAEYAISLEDIFQRDDKGLIYAEHDIKLPVKDELYGIDIAWDSTDPVLISEKGEINVLSLSGKDEIVTLTAELSLGDLSEEVSFEVLLKDNPELYKDSLKKAVARTTDELKMAVAESEEDSIVLPDVTDEGVSLVWKVKKSNYTGAIAVLGCALILAVYRSRYSFADKAAKEYRNAVLRDFESVPERFLLLIDSGMTAYNALLRICHDAVEQSAGSLSPMVEELEDISLKVDKYNANLIDEWKGFAARMQSGDMLRFCTILEDNITKGGELADKMELECRNLRESRRKNIQEKMRLMDSKMMIPMMMMLFSLIVVAIAPAMLEF